MLKVSISKVENLGDTMIENYSLIHPMRYKIQKFLFSYIGNTSQKL